jgi:hypothetical protein
MRHGHLHDHDLPSLQRAWSALLTATPPPQIIDLRKNYRNASHSYRPPAIHRPGAAHRDQCAILAELDLLMAIDGFPTIADLRAAGAQRI